MTEPAGKVRDYRVAAALFVLVAGSFVFAVTAVLVADKDPILAYDLQVLVWLHTHGNPVFTAFLLAVSYLHSFLAVVAFSLLVAIFLARRGEWQWVASLALAVPGGMLLNTILKLAFHRARPVWEDPLLTLTTESFPSGHTAGATLFYGFISVYIVSHTQGIATRVTCVVAAIVMVALVGFSRMYLGVHYPSDVLGAVSGSAAWLVLCLLAVRIYIDRHAAPRPA